VNERAQDEPAQSPHGAPGGGWDCHVHVFDTAAEVRAGHYRPSHLPLEMIETIAADHGVRHLVLVQPSVYGSDNSLLLRSLAITPGRHRGVVVVDDDVTDGELDAMHAAGVRGVRLNCVSPVGEGSQAAARFAALAPRLRARGWHLQWYAHAHRLPEIAALHQGSGVTCVLDHLAGLQLGIDAETAAHEDAWAALQALQAQGAWVKLSGWYRLGAQAPYAALVPTIARVGALFGPRLVWGSDWPHTAFAEEARPPYASTWQPVVDALGADTAARLRGRWPGIYR
jgi:predicted TIM-barrel fold metal-dependent hydrolase